MKHILINGREVNVPTQADGSISEAEIRYHGGIPQNRSLILKDPNGSNTLINRGQNVQIHPGQHIGDISQNIRGGQECCHS